jgi:hypothetical protein
MVTKIRTINFLPEIFKTDTNRQFLDATLDVLTKQPNLSRVEGYIGSKYGYGVFSTDRYVVEPSETRANYQLNPSVVFLKPDTQIAQDFINYPGIVQALKNEGAIVNNHDRLFSSDFYSWEPFIDLDKAVNYAQYYWLPFGPDPIKLSSSTLYLNDAFTVVDNGSTVQFSNLFGDNPTINLLRGGTYYFEVDQSSQFWIQGIQGISGFASINSRDVLGVTNNGISNGTITFTVPTVSEVQAYSFPGINNVDLVTTLSYSSINGQTVSSIGGNIDGVTQLNGKTLMFYNNGDLTTQIYFYTISVNSSTNIITLTVAGLIPTLEKIIVQSGTQFVGQSFYRNSGGQINQIPFLGNTVYYQDSEDQSKFGTINLVETSTQVVINVEDILGKKTYTSPNGVKLTNGLKVTFDGNVVPSSYAEKQYYVEGVGTSIVLLPVKNFIVPEPTGELVYNPFDLNPWDFDSYDVELYVPVNPEYLLINRNSRDYNAWTRSNRWFHQDVLNQTILSNGVITKRVFNESSRALRPILEFQGNLKLFNSGKLGLGPIDFFDNVTTDAFSQIVGQEEYYIDGHLLSQDDYIIFSEDTNEEVRKHIYVVNFVPTGPGGIEVINLVPASINVVDDSQGFVLSGQLYGGTTWRFDAATTTWIQCQQKNGLNQAPIYDIFDSNQKSFSSTEFYSGTDFTGTKLFSYTLGDGANDPILGFPIAYSSIAGIGDIEFTVNLNSDIFTYSNSNSDPITLNVSNGYVHCYPENDVLIKKIGWIPAASASVQRQVFQFTVTTDNTVGFVCDIPAKVSSTWSNVQVYVNDQIKDEDQYTVTVDNTENTTTVTLVDPTFKDEKVTILVLSDKVSSNAYYEYPPNLENNPFNTNITTLAIGDLRNQYRRIYTNAPGVVGEIFGNNNIHDLGDLNRYGDSIIQNSSSLVLPGTFLRKLDYNLFDSLQFNSREYIKYKTLLTDLAVSNDYSIYQSPDVILDDIIAQIAATKTGETAFFWSDMLVNRTPYVINNYTFQSPTNVANFQLSRVYDFTSANYYGLAIYLTRIISGIKTYIQLIKDKDYTVSTTNSTVIVNYNLLVGDVITVKEYNQTYGSYCPNTPTKLGLYPSYVPKIIEDTTYGAGVYFIQGHDGSYNRLYGTYVNGKLNDFRDIALYEFELRIYNNLKISSTIPLTKDDILPGQWRTTDHSWSEYQTIYTTQFLNWVGENRINYKENFYNVANKYSYNYNESSEKLNNTKLNQGYWRGIYNWFYDTDNPAYAPWQLLDLTDKPSWWESRYGYAPYTSDNTFMWDDISSGFVWNNGNSYINIKRVRPQLLDVLPVNSMGELISPFNSIVGNYNQLTFDRSWEVGDGGPAETSYLKSSTWPFDLMRLLGLTKPAKFFNLFVDRDRYKFNTEFSQYLYDNRYHIDPRTVDVYGNGTAKHSYLNWIVDYVNERGEDGTAAVKTLLTNLDVRLTYNIAGFSSKQYLKFLVEKASPESKNNSLLLSDDSYGVLLYNNVPEEKIVYSSVILQKVKEGWTVWGNSQNKPYFTTVVPKFSNRYQTIEMGNESVKITTEYYTDKFIQIPYGTLYKSLQAVSEFLVNYGRYLTNQGVSFENIEDGVQLNWIRMIQEFLYFADQNWTVGSTINLNPNAKLMTIDKDGYIVQPLTLQQQNFVLNQNLIPLQSQDCVILRDNTAFSIKILSVGDTVGYTNLNLQSIEHAVVFDNVTPFNDLIYNLTSGLRQTRLLLKGYKTAEWSGFIDAQGFIINEDNIKEWQPNTKYTKGQIVLYKNIYWSAKKLIQPITEFNKENWQETDYDIMKSGMLANPSTMAYESLNYYDVNKANLEKDADLLGFSLIGYRPRDYLAAADLSDITQVNVYKNMIKEKGTNLSVNRFKNANLAQGVIDYDVQENWAIKNANFGSVLNNNFVEAALIQSELVGNPTLIGFVKNNEKIDNVQQTVNIKDLINYERPPASANFLPLYTINYTVDRGLPSAGYVNLDDVKLSEYYFEDLNLNNDNNKTLYRGDNVWIANYKTDWGIFSAESLQTQIIRATYTQNGEIIFTFAGPHNLVKNDLFTVVNFNSNLDKFYTVKSVKSLTELIVDSITNDFNTTVVNGLGVGLKLVSKRFEQRSDISNSFISGTEFYTRRYWVDSNNSGEWLVMINSPVYKEEYVPLPTTIKLGTQVGYSDQLGYLASDVSNNLVVRYFLMSTQVLTGTNGFGKGLKVLRNFAFIASNDRVYFYRLNVELQLVLLQQISIVNNGQIAVSNDLRWLYIANDVSGTVTVYYLNPVTQQYVLCNIITGPSGVNWGNSIAVSTDGVKLVVGSPRETVSSMLNAGRAYVYSRGVDKFIANGTTTTFIISGSIVNSIVEVLVDSVVTTNYVFTANTITFNSAPDSGSVVTVNYGSFKQVTALQSNNPRNGALFGQSVDTNRFGAEILVGSPYDLTQVDEVPDVQGSVYRYTNGGQRYGVLIGNNPLVNVGQTILINGYKVVFTYSDTPSEIADQINVQTPTNILAQGDDTNMTLTVTVKDDTIEVINNVIDLVADPSVVQSLGFTLYSNTQIIKSPNKTDTGEFGRLVKMNERDGVLISAPTDTRLSSCDFDYNTDEEDNDTIFDNGATQFIDSFANSGVVYEFTHLASVNESIQNPGKYVFGQYITTDKTENINLQPKFGTSLAYNNNTIVVGSPQWFLGSTGLVSVFKPSQVDNYSPVKISELTWFIDKRPLPTVDVKRLREIHLYNYLNNQTIEYLDYIDPLQGKLLGAITTNVDYIDSIDPASYIGTTVSWGATKIGTTWLDSSTIRILNYHQPDILYNSRYWAKPFPGSTADVYTWIESSTPPVNYSGRGFVTNFENYVSTTVLDSATNSLVNKYYFWVKGYDAVPTGKTLSPLNITQYLLDPISSGISFLAAVTTNVVALYNCQEFINDTTALHLGFSRINNTDKMHQSWTLIRDGISNDFLSGFPSVTTPIPVGLYLKYIDSFSGLDENQFEIPDPFLPPLLRYGVSVRPRQSMFRDRNKALENYITYANSILIKYPITEIRSLEFLNKYGPFADPLDESYGRIFDTRLYWKRVNWWVEGYNDNTKIDLEVATYNDLLKLEQGQLQVGTSGNIIVEEGLITRVTNNSVGNSETYIWSEASGWTRIGLENGTIQILSSLWLGPFGWASTSWSSGLWDKLPHEEIRWIIRWLNEQAYIGELIIERNRSLILMFRYIQSESLQDNNYLPWLNKTSLVDIKHKVRDLLPYKKYQRDSQEFLSGFVNEVKPYHVYVKNFMYSYEGLDIYDGDVSDFDVPAQYNTESEQFESPQLVYSNPQNSDEYLPTDSIWNAGSYNQWFSNFGLTISNNEISDVSTTELALPILASSGTIIVKSATLLPDTGIITIDDEQISYDSLDRINNTLTDLVRGVNGTFPANHPIDSKIFLVLGDIVVLDSGRNYTVTPKISAYIDTSIYPAPRQEAKFSAVIQNNKIVGINLDNPGSGYTVKPTLIIEPSVIQTFSSANVNVSSNTITIINHQFQTGDCVIYNKTGSTVSPAGLKVGEYYYVRVLDANTVTLYTTYKNAVDNNKVPSEDKLRVELCTTGTGTTNQLNITARAIFFVTSRPVREFKIKLKFDRVSYEEVVDDNSSNNAANRIEEFYNPTVNMSGKDLTQLIDQVEYPNTIYQGAEFGVSNGELNTILDTNLQSPAFNLTSITSNYYNLQGGHFADGYGPEELVPGLVTDLLNFKVSTNSYTVNYRVVVDRFGNHSVYNNNSLTQTTLAQDFQSVGDLEDTLVVDDVTKLVKVKSVTVTTDSQGKFRVLGVESNAIVLIDLGITNNYNWTAVGPDGIEIIVDDISSPTVLNVTVAYGNMLLLNSEFIKFSSIDLMTNTIYGLQRGVMSSITNTFVASGTVVQGLLNRDKLGGQYWYEWWYHIPNWDMSPWETYPWDYDDFITEPLSESVHPAAIFLKKTLP